MTFILFHHSYIILFLSFFKVCQGKTKNGPLENDYPHNHNQSACSEQEKFVSFPFQKSLHFPVISIIRQTALVNKPQVNKTSYINIFITVVGIFSPLVSGKVISAVTYSHWLPVHLQKTQYVSFVYLITYANTWIHSTLMPLCSLTE